MASITPALDTLLTQVHGRAGDVERFSASRLNGPLGAVAANVAGEDAARRGAAAGRAHGSIAGRAAQASRGASTATEGASARAASAADPRALAASDRPAADTGRVRARLSGGGRALAGVLARFPEAPTSLARAPLASGGALPTVTALAAALAAGVEQSGVFYEAHLRDWYGARLSDARIQAESRNRLTRARQTLDIADTGVDEADDEAAAILRQQIEVLHQGVFRWQGPVQGPTWMDWQIEGPIRRAEAAEHDAEDEHESDTPAVDPDKPPRFTTAFGLELPRLGRLEVRMVFEDGGIRTDAFSAAALLLRDRVAELETRLAAGGLTPVAVAIYGEAVAREPG